MPEGKNTEFKDVPIESLKNRIKEFKEARLKYEDNWNKANDFYNSRHWAGIAKISFAQSEPVFNKVFEFIETMRGYLADNKWGIDCIPASVPSSAKKNTDEILAMVDAINKLLDFLWVDNRMQLKLAEVLMYVFMYGTGIIKCTFDPDNIGDGGIGQIETSVLSPRYIFPDPDATCVQDASAIFEHHPVSYRWVIDRYPDKAQELIKSGETSKTEYQEGKGSSPAGPVSNSEGKRVDIWECWYRDSTLQEDSPEGEPPKPAYPNGRYTLMTEGGIILDDGPCMYSSWPYIRFIEIPKPGQFFGDCTVHKALGIQETINQILRSIIDNGLWLIHGIWVVDSTSGVTPTTLAGYAPRDVVVKHPGTQVERDGGTALPNFIFEVLQQQVEAFDRVVGLPDVLRGIVPSRQPVQTTMMQQESGEVRTRERQRRVEESLADLGQLWLDIVSNHWADKRTIRSKRALGGFDMFELSKKDLEDWAFDVQVIPGSTGPMDKVAQLQMLKEARTEMGMPIPDSFIARVMSIPGLEQAMLEQQQQAMADEEAAAEEQEAPTPETEAPPAELPAPSPEELAMALDPTMGAGVIPPELMGAMPPGMEGLPPEMIGPSEFEGGL